MQLQHAADRQLIQACNRDRKKDHEILRCDNKTTHDRLAAQSDQLAEMKDSIVEAHRQDVAHLADQMERLVVAFTPKSKHKGSRSISFVVDDSSSAASSRLSSSMVSATEDNRNLDTIKKIEAEYKKLHRDMKSVEMKNKQLEDKCRVLSATPLDKKLRAKARKQPLSENMENSINKHVDDKIIGRASRSSSRTALGDVNQDTSNPAPRRNLRRSTRN